MLYLIFGNHSYDVNYKAEATYISHYQNRNTTLSNVDGELEKKDKIKPSEVLRPRITVANTNKVDILYLNLDPSMLVCSNKLIYLDGKDFQVVKNAKELKAKVDLLTNFKKCVTDKWFDRFPEEEFMTNSNMNAHIMYFRQTLQLLKNIPKVGGTDWRIVRMHQPIFNPEVDYMGIKLNPVLMKAFKDAHIHLFWTSHNHSAQVDLSLYE